MIKRVGRNIIDIMKEADTLKPVERNAFVVARLEKLEQTAHLL